MWTRTKNYSVEEWEVAENECDIITNIGCIVGISYIFLRHELSRRSTHTHILMSKSFLRFCCRRRSSLRYPRKRIGFCFYYYSLTSCCFSCFLCYFFPMGTNDRHWKEASVWPSLYVPEWCLFVSLSLSLSRFLSLKKNRHRTICII